MLLVSFGAGSAAWSSLIHWGLPALGCEATDCIAAGWLLQAPYLVFPVVLGALLSMLRREPMALLSRTLKAAGAAVLVVAAAAGNFVYTTRLEPVRDLNDYGEEVGALYASVILGLPLAYVLIGLGSRIIRRRREPLVPPQQRAGGAQDHPNGLA